MFMVNREYWIGGFQESPTGIGVSYTFYKLYRDCKVMCSKFMHIAVSDPVLIHYRCLVNAKPLAH
jgi:hypothetical protein